ncbi:MAG: PepSY domain-containing protein [Pseudomonadota bacterium]
MIRTFTFLAVALGFTQALADQEPTQAEIDKINAMLTEMQCEMDDDDIEKEDDGFELDDVICADGTQYDIDLNAAFEVVEKRAE